MRSVKLLTIVFTLMVIASIYWAWQLNLSISDWLTIVGTWIFGAVLMFELFNFISKGIERRLKHSKDLVKEVFRMGILETGKVNYVEDRIIPSYVKWAEDSPFFSYAIQHLKDRKYEKILQSYENGKKYAKNIIDEIVKKMQQYRESVGRKLIESEIPIPAYEDFIDYQTKHYNKKFIEHMIFKDIEHMLEEGKKYNEVRLNVSTSSKLSTLSYGATTFAIGDVDSLKRLQDVIEKLENDEMVISILKDINSAKVQLKANKELELFDREREEIVRQVNYGQNPLKGKCDLCP